MTTLLFVEDDLVVLDDLTTIVDWDEEDYQVYTAVNGKQGIKKYEEVRPQIVVTDVKMPLMDGLEMMQAIRKENPYVPFLILSAYEDFAYVQDALRQGARDYIRKTTITKDLLLEKVSMLKNEWELAAENALTVLKGLFQELVGGSGGDLARMALICTCFPQERVLFPFISYMEKSLGQALPRDGSVFQSLESLFLTDYSDVIAAAIEAIREQFSDPELSNTVIASRVGLSERRLAERFKAETGHTINDFITLTRMNAAKKLLRSKKLIYEVAALTGYNTPQYFGSVFKQNTGMTPNDYRKRYAK